MSRKQDLQAACESIFNKEGLQAVNDFINALPMTARKDQDHLSYAKCNECDMRVPTYDKYCLICGQNVTL